MLSKLVPMLTLSDLESGTDVSRAGLMWHLLRGFLAVEAKSSPYLGGEAHAQRILNFRGIS